MLEALVGALCDGTVDVIDLTAPLSEETPVIDLPPGVASRGASGAR